MEASISPYNGLPLEINTTRFLGNRVVEQGARWPWQAGYSKWKWERDLGSGSFGVVFLEREQRTGKLRAVKRIDAIRFVVRELQTIAAMRGNELFVEFLGWYRQDQAFIYLAMEYIENGDLEQYLTTVGAKGKEDAEEITSQVLKGLVTLHDKNICHRDLKPQNILLASLSPIRIKLADFGTSKCVDESTLRTNLGTLGYQAPELLGLLPRSIYRGRNHSFAVDIWSLGCLVFKVLTLQTPFELHEESEAFDTDTSGLSIDTLKSLPQIDMSYFQDYCCGREDFPEATLRPHVSDWGVDFVRNCLAPDPQLRITPKQALMHPWLSVDLKVLNSELQLLGIEVGLDNIKKWGSILSNRRSTPRGKTTPLPPHNLTWNVVRLLLTAAYFGYTSAAEMMLEITDDDVSGTYRLILQNSLQLAARGGHLKLVTLLLDRGADVNGAAPIHGGRALQAAACGGHLVVVKFLLDRGADIDGGAKSLLNQTAIQAAATRGHTHVFKLLLDRGAYIDSSTLMEAIVGGQLEVVKCLLDMKVFHNDSPSALGAVARGGLLNTAAQLLSELDSHIERGSLHAPLHEANSCHLEIIKLLFDSGLLDYPTGLSSPLDLCQFKLDTIFKGGVVNHPEEQIVWKWPGMWQTVSGWNVAHRIGGGGHGDVYLQVEQQTQRLRAVKKISVKGRKRVIERELRIMLALRDNGLFVKCLGWYNSTHATYIVMEYIEGGDLAQYIRSEFGRITEETAREIVEQVIEGLVVLHKEEICHRDLKSKNILIANLKPIRIKIADFGSSEWTRYETNESIRGGTMGYMAPEMLRYYLEESFDHKGVDMWALGCLVFEILTYLETDYELFCEYYEGRVEFPEETLKFWIPLSEWGVEFVKRCLTPKPWLRITSSEARQHRWITKRYELEDFIFDYETGNTAVMGEALLFAAGNGQTTFITRLLDKSGVDINAKEARVRGKTALQEAAGRGHTEAVRLLLDRGADINVEAPDFEGRTALQAAAGNGHIEVVRHLLERGAIISARAGFDNGLTALQAAAGGGHIEVVRLLLSEGADVYGRAGDKKGRTALQAAAGGGHIAVMKLLLSAGANINDRGGNSGGLTALQAAAKGGHTKVVKLLLTAGADINARAGESGGRTALQAAAGIGHVELAVFLLSKDAKINAEATQSNGRTALQAAAGGGHVKMVELLLDKGADINAKAGDYYGRTALQAAAGGGYIDVVSLLLGKGADVNAGPGHSSGRTALQAAAGKGYIEIVLLLLRSGANINAEAGDIEGRTALQAAAGGGYIDVVSLLLEKGADSSASAGWGNGMTASEAAANGGHSAVARLIFENLYAAWKRVG